MSPKKFYDIVKSLNKEQKKAVREMGLGSLLRIATNGISGKLACFVVNSFNPSDMKMHLPNAKIDITPALVHDLLGNPPAVREMRLGSLLRIATNGISEKLARFVVNSFNPSDMKMHLPNAKIDITLALVHDLLGNPPANDEESDTDENEDMKLDELVFKAKKNYKKLVNDKMKFGKLIEFPTTKFTESDELKDIKKVFEQEFIYKSQNEDETNVMNEDDAKK
ncbi:unnamed protein product [Lactuca virosa]|uniref:Uncharacterized protein n=1 Tax=Lactuca virosa TaxID=75947 RepID=A0AAU9NEE1_9ASTR|nr:unnamed protein product [Lactuca virosa]